MAVIEREGERGEGNTEGNFPAMCWSDINLFSRAGLLYFSTS